jgi:hypothetical protein
MLRANKSHFRKRWAEISNSIPGRDRLLAKALYFSYYLWCPPKYPDSMSAPDTVLDKSDPGDDVAARFNYQHCYAAINAIRLVTDGANVAEIICENHEDLLLKTRSGKFIGLQIKTRLLNQPLFKGGDEQVKKALKKFCSLDCKFPGAFEKFDFTTNHAFWDAEETQSNLPWLLKTLQERGGVKGLRANNPLRQFVEGIANSVGLKPTDIAATLKRTVVRGHASDIAHIRGTVREALSECPGVVNLPFSTVAEIANAIIALARDASTKVLKGPITDLFAPGTDLTQVIDSQQLLGKRICKADVLAVIDQFKNSIKPYQDLDLKALVTTSDVPHDLVRAVRKLARGGLESGRVTNIEDRVRSFESLFTEWTRKHGVEEATKRYSSILGAVQFEAAEAQANAEKNGEPYGSLMYGTLAGRLIARAKNEPDQLYKCCPEHLIGAAGVLTQKCKVWWSSSFDICEEAK